MRSHFCGTVTEDLVGESVTLCGWVHRRRDHGGVIFVDLRDRSGLVQVVYDPDTVDAFATAEQVRSEYVLRVEGRVRERPPGTVNPEMPTGAVEVLGKGLEVLNPARTPPFQLDEDDVGEETRLRYRYVDLRRPEMFDRLTTRARITRAMREFLDADGFIDIETPMLTRATPEGARDYLVPSRTHPGHFFALPQSPQLFKQLLMMSGFERYYQIVRCFRDEDLRSDRQPEFTQLDVEMSFVEEEDVIGLMETLVREVFSGVLDVELPDPFPRMAYAEAMQRYASDAPDLRNPLELVELSGIFEDAEFKVFSGPARDPGCRVAALKIPGGGAMTRRELDELTQFVQAMGAKGMAWIKAAEPARGRDGMQSPVLKFLADGEIAALLEKTGPADGDLLLFGAGETAVVNRTLSALRDRLGRERGLVSGGWAPVWITDFPGFELDEDEGRWKALHHPFTAPGVSKPAELLERPAEASSRAYDLVLNGHEIGGGSIRIHQRDMQAAVFELLGLSAEQADRQFGFFLKALDYGVPPHGGIAFGLDRWVMLMAQAESIREVIAFPKTQSGACPLTDAPAAVEPRQLRELGLRPL